MLTHSILDAVVKGDGKYIDGKCVIVDRELGRTKKDWMPRLLGCGKGNGRRDIHDEEAIRKMRKEIEAEVKDDEPAETQVGEENT